MNTSNIKDFFLSNQHVWVSENFQNIILAQYNDSDTQSVISSQYLDAQDFKDAIKSNIIFSDSDAFLRELMMLISKQTDGEDGVLLNDSSANYFFVKTKNGDLYSVLVRFEIAQRLWRCGAYLQDDVKVPQIRLFLPK